MKKALLILLAVACISSGYTPSSDSNIEPVQAYKSGEWFKFRIHYGMFNASFATLEVEDKILNGKKVHHLKGFGESTGLMHLFFKVEDRYESYVDRETGKPYRFIRDIDEGGHTKDIQIDFDHLANKAYIVPVGNVLVVKQSIQIGKHVLSRILEFLF